MIAFRRLAANVAVLAAFAALALIASAFVPTLFGYESHIVTSGSMGRAVPVGSVALTRMVDARTVDVGDVVTLRAPHGRTPVTHRVIEIQRDSARVVLRTKGDANTVPDPERAALGGRVARVERVVPLVGYLVAFARSPLGLLVFFVFPIFTLVSDRRKRARHDEPAARPSDPIPTPQPAPRMPMGFGIGTPVVTMTSTSWQPPPSGPR